MITVVSLTFEGLSKENYDDSKAFCLTFIELVHDALELAGESDDDITSWIDDSISTFQKLSRHIRKWCRDKQVVLIIDEVDKISNNQVYLDFLSMLRKKYLAAQDELDFTFYSVILAGVYDVRNLKWKVKLASDRQIESTIQVYNSPRHHVRIFCQR